MNPKLLSCCLQRLQVTAGIVLQTEHEGLSRRRLFDRLSMMGKLVADRGADEVRAVGIKAFLH